MGKLELITYKFISILFLLASALYGFKHFSQLISFNSLLYQYCILIFITFFGITLFISAFRNSLIVRGWMACLLVTFFSIVVIEIILQSTDIPASDRRGEKMRLAVLQKVTELINTGAKAQPNIGPGDLAEYATKTKTPLYLGNSANAIVVYEEEEEGLTSFQTDENGLRNPPSFYDKTIKFDAMIFGDSFVDGCCVAKGHTLPDVISQETGMTVYNAGKGGAGLLHMLASYIEYGRPKKPKNVVLVYMEHLSVMRGIGEHESSADYRRYLTDLSPYKGGLNKLRNERDIAVNNIVLKRMSSIFEDEYLMRKKIKSSIFEFLKIALTESKIFKLLYNADKILDTKTDNTLAITDCSTIENERDTINRVISYFSKSSQIDGGNFFLAYLPASRFSVDTFPDCERELVNRLVKKAGGNFIDLVDVLAKEKNVRGLYSNVLLYGGRVQGHLNRNGYRLIGKKIAEQLKKKQL